MINSNAVIAILTAYTVNGVNVLSNVVRGRETLSENVSPTMPALFVINRGVKCINPHTELAKSLIDPTGQDLQQYFDVIMQVPEETFETYWSYMFQALIGKNPTPAYQNRTAFTYIQGEQIGLQNGIKWNIDRWVIGFPPIYNNL